MCNKWVNPSTKDCERTDLDKSTPIYCAKDPTQKDEMRLKWLDALKNNNFEESLIRYLVEAGADSMFGPILKNKIFLCKF